jgi:hypothetical protein
MHTVAAGASADLLHILRRQVARLLSVEFP